MLVFNQTREALPRKGNAIKIIGIIFIFAALFEIDACAAKLTVTIQGTGDGFVFGEGIDCGSPDREGDCEEIYSDETTLDLEPYPDDRSEFSGWLVDGQPQQGMLIIRKDMTLTAIFQKIPHPDFETIETRPAEIQYTGDDHFPIFNTNKEIVGTVIPIKEHIQGKPFEFQLIIPQKAQMIIPALSGIEFPLYADHLVMYGDILLDGLNPPSAINLYYYSLTGELLNTIQTHLSEAVLKVGGHRSTKS